MGDDIAAAGLDLMAHHHEAEMRDNAREWRYLLAHTEPKLVSFCLDADWVFRAGLSPIFLIETSGFRLRAVHLSNPRNGQDQSYSAMAASTCPRSPGRCAKCNTMVCW